MVHGGVRYLEKAVFKLDYGQLQLVYEGLHERDRLLSNAAHLARPLPILTVSVNCLCAASPPLVFVSCELCVCFMWRMSVLFVFVCVGGGGGGGRMFVPACAYLFNTHVQVMCAHVQ